MNRLFCLVASLTILPAITFAEEALPPVEQFAALPFMETARLSPGGKRLAALVNTASGITMVATLDLAAGGKMKPIFSTDNKEKRINWVRWANDERLLVSIRYPDKIGRIGIMETRLYSVKHDGEDLTDMLDQRRAKRVPQIRDRVIDILPDEEHHVLMSLDMIEPGVPDVYRVDVRSGKSKKVMPGRKGVVDWFTDRQHRVRGLVSQVRGQRRIQIRSVDGTDWTTLWEFDIASPDSVSVMNFGHDPNELYIRAYHDGRLAVFQVDIRKPAERKLVFADERYDVEGRLMYSRLNQRVIGLRTTRQEQENQVWDEGYRRLFDQVQNALGDVPATLVDFSQDEQRYVLFASNGTHPGTFYLGNRATSEMSPLASRYPTLDAAALVGKRKVSYRSGDGTVIDGWLTEPRKNAGERGPAIVFPHGGPAARTNTGFDYWTEFFASRGYAVLEMDFRGSSGQGLKWMTSAFANWDAVTQDDIQAGAKYLVSEGIADPERLCIVGASFGGYAALMGVARTDLYRCAISIAGVTDLVALRNRARRFMFSEGTERQIGSDTGRLREASPITHAADVSAPVLLIHGATDRVVDIEQGRDMQRAFLKAGKAVEYLELETGDHYLSNRDDRIATFRAMDRFLAKHL